ncbi:hypothetical protein M441DRAFT_408531 [Trichoderma asperellum CBS 433.97]|uniref:Uncharacterized protein n=1 Tax=Trichoderma asperellum (strain ATCC 204424 / CBS 433.97 / NBRC 101777) TaxID=1042311 RepID=A0A2T3Z711_TRIA4|nr:hypothetical protein M441DRAFT_408531 [Trichoderma asperellum CBS 433.97]PTB40578.1 hypothetical protein M441DRAFT_408531 [Trichoderma asperellum CBS 433.97]
MGGQLCGRRRHEGRGPSVSCVVFLVSLNYFPVSLTLDPWGGRYVCTHRAHCINASSSAVGCKPPLVRQLAFTNTSSLHRYWRVGSKWSCFHAACSMLIRVSAAYHFILVANKMRLIYAAATVGRALLYRHPRLCSLR